MTALKRSKDFQTWLDDIGAAVMQRSDHFSLLKNQFCDSEGSGAEQSDLIDNRYLSLIAPAELGDGQTQFLRVSSSLQVVTSRWPQHYELALRYAGEDWIRISFMLQGRMMFDVGDNQPVLFEGASAFIATYPSGFVSTDVFAKGVDIHWASILIKREELLNLIGLDFNLMPREIADALEKSRLPVFARQYPLSIHCARALSDLLNSQMTLLARPVFMQAKALELLSAFFDHLASTVRQSNMISLSARDRSKLQLAREIVKEDMLTSLSLPDVAKIVGLNRNKLSQGFRLLHGCTIQQYSFELKMQIAEAYLRRREGSLGELAKKLGYSHANNLSAAIKKHFGHSARELQKSL